jgi:ERCC4-type nuclease
MNQTLASPACADLNDESVDVVADDRERVSGVIDSLRYIANVSVRIERLEGVMRADRDELQTVEGIGAKVADSIRWAVNEKIESYGDKTFFSI